MCLFWHASSALLAGHSTTPTDSDSPLPIAPRYVRKGALPLFVLLRVADGLVQAAAAHANALAISRSFSGSASYRKRCNGVCAKSG
jgi:hypothetical protein